MGYAILSVISFSSSSHSLKSTFENSTKDRMTYFTISHRKRRRDNPFITILKLRSSLFITLVFKLLIRRYFDFLMTFCL